MGRREGSDEHVNTLPSEAEGKCKRRPRPYKSLRSLIRTILLKIVGCLFEVAPAFGDAGALPGNVTLFHFAAEQSQVAADGWSFGRSEKFRAPRVGDSRCNKSAPGVLHPMLILRAANLWGHFQLQFSR